MRLLRSSVIALAAMLAGASPILAQNATYGTAALSPVGATTSSPYFQSGSAAGYFGTASPPTQPTAQSIQRVGATTQVGQQSMIASTYDYAKFSEPAPEVPAADATGPIVPEGAPATEMGSNDGCCYDQALGSPCCGGCAPCGPCGGGGVWFGALGGLVMTRANANPVWTSALVNNNFNQVLNSVDANGGWVGGGEFRVGRQFCCGRAVEFTWWGIAPITSSAGISDPGNLLTPIDLFGVNIGAQPATAFFDNADAHRIWRRDTFNNLEFNLYSMPLALPYKPCTISWLTGIRYFQFNEGLIFGSVAGGHQFGDNGGINEAYINAQVRNRLLGAQVGAIANYFIRPRLSLFAVPKFGIYNNWMHENFSVYRGDGLTAMNITANQSNITFLSQFDTGLNYAITPRFSVYGGYRVVIVSNLALADNQFPHYLIDQPEIAHIKPNGDLILHGAMFGAQFIF